MRPTKLNKRTLPKRKPAKTGTTTPATKKVKVKAKFNLKGIPAKYKLVCNLVLIHANTQTECDELLLAGVSAFERIHETETPEIAKKLEEDVVTKAIMVKKESFTAKIE